MHGILSIRHSLLPKYCELLIMTLTKTIQNPRKSLKCLHELSRAIKIIYADQYSEEGSALVSVQGSEALFCYQKNL